VQGHPTFKEKILERPLNSLSVIVACSTAGKMASIMYKLFVEQNLNGHYASTVAHHEHGRTLLTESGPNILGTRVYEVLKHSLSGGTLGLIDIGAMTVVQNDGGIEVVMDNDDDAAGAAAAGAAAAAAPAPAAARPNPMQTFTQHDATTACDLVHFWMSLAQFTAEEFDAHVKEWRDNENPDRPFGSLVSRENVHTDIRRRLVAAYERAQAHAVSSECDPAVGSTVMNEVMEADTIRTMLDFHTALHNAVLDTINVFCNLLRIHKCIPQMVHAYRNTVYDLFNNKDTPCSNANLKKLFDVFTCIVRLIEKAGAASYVQDAETNLTKALNLHYPETPFSLPQMMFDKKVRGDKKIQSTIIHLLEDAFLPTEMKDIQHKIMETFPKADYHVPNPKHGKRLHSELVDKTMHEFKIKDFFFDMAKYNNIKNVMRSGREMTGYMLAFMHNLGEWSDETDMATAVNLSYKFGVLTIPHTSKNSGVTAITRSVANTPAGYPNYAAGLTHARTSLEQYKTQAKSRTLDTVAMYQEYLRLVDAATFSKESTVIGFTSIRIRNTPYFSSTKHTIVHAATDMASTRAHQRVFADMNAFNAVIAQDAAGATARAQNIQNTLWYREGIDPDMNSLFCPKLDKRFHQENRAPYNGQNNELGGINFSILENVYLQGTCNAITFEIGLVMAKNRFQSAFGTQITAEKWKPYGNLRKHAHKTDPCAPVTQYVRDWTGDVCTETLARNRRADKPREKEWDKKKKAERKDKKKAKPKGKKNDQHHKKGPDHKSQHKGQPHSRPGSAKGHKK